MSKERKAIRAAVAAQLARHAPLTAIVKNRIFVSRYTPLSTSKELPAVSIYMHRDERVEERTISAPREHYRSIFCSIECKVIQLSSDSEKVDDLVDDLTEAVEMAMGLDDTLGDKCSDLEYLETQIEVENTGEQVAATANVVFRIEYTKSPSPSPDTLDNFDEANTRFNLAGEQATADELKSNITGIYDP